MLIDAFDAGETPKVTQPGISYMLKGGDDTRTVAPFSPVHEEGGEWVYTPCIL